MNKCTIFMIFLLQETCTCRNILPSLRIKKVNMC
jgi:hypothetical protein